MICPSDLSLTAILTDFDEVIDQLEGDPSIEAAVEFASANPWGALPIYAIRGIKSILIYVEMGYISKRKYVLGYDKMYRWVQ